jgi:hypothetical protein
MQTMSQKFLGRWLFPDPDAGLVLEFTALLLSTATT